MDFIAYKSFIKLYMLGKPRYNERAFLSSKRTPQSAADTLNQSMLYENLTTIGIHTNYGTENTYEILLYFQ